VNIRSIREFVVKIRLKRLHIIKIQYKLPTNTPKRIWRWRWWLWWWSTRFVR